MLKFLDEMRITRQGPLGSEGSDNPTIQQLMEKLMAEVRVEQVIRQDQLMVEIDVSRASNDEFWRTNEELRRSLR